MKPGEVIAERFELEQFVARGGMGDVWRASDRVGGGLVALKLLSATYPQLVRRMAFEARALAQLDHPAIVRHVAHETDEQRGLYLAMEWLDGVTLSERLKTEPLTVDETLALASRIAEGLGAAHGRGMVHRDIKPLNIFLSGNRVDQAKILDFGIVRLADWQQITATGVGMGTPEYMAPEQARCDKEIGPPADIFALGCVMYRCLTGQPAFRGRRIEAVLAKIAMVDEMPRVSDLRPDIPGPVDRLVSKLMSYDPAARPADGARAAAMIQSLRESVAIGLEPTAQVTPRRALTHHELEPVSMIFADLELGDADTVPSEVIDLDALASAAGAPGADDTVETSMEYVQVLRGPSDASRALPAVRRALEPYGARVELLLNGSIVAMLRGGAAATDLATRAARAALAIRSILPDAAVGVASGRAQADERGDLDPIIDAAAGLVRPRSREIWLDKGTSVLLPARFDQAEHHTQPNRMELLAEKLDTERPGEIPRRLLGRDVSCVGRNRLLRQLAAGFAGCVEDRAAEAMVVLGDAGIGKSRFRAELVSRIEAEQPRLTVFAAWGDPIRSKAPYGLLGRALRVQLGIPGGDVASQRNQLRAAVRARVEPDEVERVVEFIGELTGVRFPDETSPRLRAARRDPELMADQIRRAFEDWLAAEAVNAPVLFVIDDMQWADDASVELVGSALRRAAELPLMVLALGRPETQDRFPNLGDHWNRQEIVLDALRTSDCEALVDEALGDQIDAATRQSLVERSAGNPFYLEELIRAAAAGEADRLPESILASVQLRIGRLPEGARQVLRAAAVYGRRFWPAGLLSLLEQGTPRSEIEDWLGLLEREELVQKVAASSPLAGEPEYHFRHDLTREAAYASLTESDRQTGHRLAGQWLESAGEPDAIVLAEHFAGGGATEQAVDWFERAAEQALAERDETDALESLRTAARYLLRAADTAAAAYANETAVSFYERGVALLGTIDPMEATRARLRLADVRARLGQRERALKELAESLEWIGDRDPDLQTEVLLSRANLEARSQDAGALKQAMRIAQAARDLASRRGRRDLEAEAYTCLAAILVQRGAEGASHKAVKYAERALAIQRERGKVAEGLWRLGNAFLIRNELDRATTLYHDALVAARRSGEQLLAACCRANLGMVAFRKWDIPAALEHTEAALAGYRRIGHVQRIAEGMLNLGTFNQFGGRPDVARPLLEEALEKAGGDWVITSLCRESLAELERQEGNELEAQHHLSVAADVCNKVHAYEKQAFYLGLLAESQWATGHVAAAIESLGDALHVGKSATMSNALIFFRLGLFERAARLFERFLEIEPDPDRLLLAELALARIAVESGQVEEARKHCEDAQAFVPTGIRRYAVPVRTLADCLEGELSKALEGLKEAHASCGRHVYAELLCDVGRLILDCDTPSEGALREFVELANENRDQALAFRVAYLQGWAYRKLGDDRRASERFARAHELAMDLCSGLPADYRDVLEVHPWVVQASQLRVV